MLCLECGKEVKQINFRHLKNCSNISPSEYKLRHPGAELFSEETKRKCAKPLSQNGMWKGGISFQKFYCEKCGKERDKRSKRNLCIGCSNQGEGNAFYGKHHSEKTKTVLRIKTRRYGKENGFYGKKHSPETIKIISNKNILWWKNLTPEQREKVIANFLEKYSRHKPVYRNTSIEKKIANILNEQKINFKQNKNIGMFNVDFLLDNNFIIECYGDYWHCNPSTYKEDYFHKQYKMYAKDKWKNDFIREQKLIQKGYKVLIIWESEINQNKENLKEFLLNKLKETSK